MRNQTSSLLLCSHVLKPLSYPTQTTLVPQQGLSYSSTRKPLDPIAGM